MNSSHEGEFWFWCLVGPNHLPHPDRLSNPLDESEGGRLEVHLLLSGRWLLVLFLLLAFGFSLEPRCQKKMFYFELSRANNVVEHKVLLDISSSTL